MLVEFPSATNPVGWTKNRWRAEYDRIWKDATGQASFFPDFRAMKSAVQ
jgi:hypothetical protein